MTGFLYAYFSCNWHTITWITNQETKLQLLILDTTPFAPIYICFMVPSCFIWFLKLMESATEFFAQNKFLKDILISKFVIKIIICNQ